ncbi:hypothetical protein SpCBS45565_g06372 [Spizellomyces sp. 'palustris']|nr:hypothetical protein SpCBS45565_g06372 [Spizellomyces sp. 'palustris']
MPDVNQTDAINLWFSPEWCDWRWRISGCNDASLWKIVYICTLSQQLQKQQGSLLMWFGISTLGHTVWGLLVMRIAIIIKKIYIKLWRKGRKLIEIVSGGLKPRAAEVFILAATLHMFGRALYTSIVLGDGFKLHAVTEFFHEWPWTILYDGAVLFNIGIIYATPRFKMSPGTNASGIEKVRLPGPRALNIIMAIYIIIPSITLSLFGILDGHARDNGNWELATTYNSIHYGLWGSYCWLLAALSSYFGVKLIMLLRASANGALEKTDSSGDFRRALLTLIITLSCTIVIEVSFALVLIFYSIFRESMHVHRWVSIWIGLVWILITPTMLTPIFVMVAYGLIKGKQEKMTRNASSAATTGKSSNGGKSSFTPVSEATPSTILGSPPTDRILGRV